MVELQNVCAGYRDRAVLTGVDLPIPAGRVTVIAGPNGCGKSTLLKVLAGLIPLSGGEIRLSGRPISDFSPRELAQTVAYLPQNRTVPELTALRLVLHGRFPYLDYPRRYRARDFELARSALDAMGVADLADRPLADLSGGQRQKVYLAMALAQDTPVILLDEPTTFLDVAHQLQLMDQARLLADRGKAVVLVLHDLTLALETADQLAVLNGGQIAALGNPDAVFASGCLEQVFGVSVSRFRAAEGWRYYYERRQLIAVSSPVK